MDSLTSQLSVICFTILLKARLMIMRDTVDISGVRLKELREAICACNVYRIAIKSDDDYIDLELVKVNDYDKIVMLYNSLVSDLKDGDLTRSYTSTINILEDRFFR